MKLHLGIISTILVTCGMYILSSHPVLAESIDSSFRVQGINCSNDPKTNNPTTFVEFQYEGKKRSIPLITWTNRFINNPNWSRERRCIIVSSRLDKQFQKNLNFNFFLITSKVEYTNSVTGELETANVICFTENDDDKCQSIFLTLSPLEDPDQALKDIQNSFFDNFSPLARGNPDPLVRGGKKFIPLHSLEGWIRKMVNQR
jgi:hypothetical protein